MAGGIWRAAAVFVVVLMLLIGVREFTDAERPIPRWDPVSTLLQPLAQGFDVVAGMVGEFMEDAAAFPRLEEENERLLAELERRPALESRLAQLQEENARLRALLELRTQPVGASGVPAEVVGRDPATWYRRLELNRGTLVGVREGYVAITPSGLAGRVWRAGPTGATLRLLSDPDSAVPAVVERGESRAQGVVLGDAALDGTVRMRFFAREADVRVGDSIVTTGLGGLFPEGVLVGEVVRVEEGDYGLVRYARVLPATHLDRLELVLLIPPAEQGDAAGGGEDAALAP